MKIAVLARLAAFLAACAIASTPSHAGAVNICNGMDRRIQVAVTVKDGVNYLTGTWSNRGWHTLTKGGCYLLGGWGSSWGRVWGYVAIKREKKVLDIAEMGRRQARLLDGFSFYDRLMLYLPGTRQRRKLAQRSLDIWGTPRLSRWEYVRYERKRAGPLEDQGAASTDYRTCLPRSGFNFDTSGRPPHASSCGSDQELARFAMEFFVKPDGTLTMTVHDTLITTDFRYRS